MLSGKGAGVSTSSRGWVFLDVEEAGGNDNVLDKLDEVVVYKKVFVNNE